MLERRLFALLAVTVLVAACGGGTDDAEKADSGTSGEQLIQFDGPSETGPSEQAPSETATDATAGPSEQAPDENAAAKPVAYKASSYTAEAPAGWEIVDDERELGPGLRRSRWESPDDPKVNVLIDTARGAKNPPSVRAENTRRSVSQRPGYREIVFRKETVDLATVFEWSYERAGVRVIDWFFDDCEDGFAVQGTAPAASFDRHEATFRVVLGSVASSCE